ncbi:MAG: vitamin B12-dependent ribonucleotide reductase [Dehalococcoidales bacterium]|nr:vitamin B12-dependent ribonucleotide reductase [Dehalococcoidales bacterium]
MTEQTNTNDETNQELNHTEILKAVVADAESMGLRDKDKIEKLTSRVIELLDRSQPLPGMEDLVPKTRRTSRKVPSRAEIKAIVQDIMNARDDAVIPPERHEPPVTDAQNQTPDTSKKETEPMIEQRPRTRRKARPRKGLDLSENALRVLEKRYLQKDKEGKVIEKPEELFRRVARTIAAAEKVYDPSADTAAIEDEFYRVMTALEFLPNSPTLMNAGRELGQLSACFVLPIEDSMESIFEAVKNTALIHKSGGGTGFSFTRLRPATDRVGSTGGVASGPISFMKAFDAATDVIKQGGMRRGANMAILNVDHPDIMNFITAKSDMTSLTNFNLSVAVTEGFMEAVKNDGEFDLINPRTKEAYKTIKAKELFEKIVDLAWKTGDPGIVFIDRINAANPTPHLGKIESTNPCGEQPLLPYESCNLGSINLSRMVKVSGDTVSIDFEKLTETIKIAVRFLDNVIDVNKFPLPQIAEMTRSTRKIGLGIMGFADMLIQLGIPYNSEEALHTADELMSFINDEAMKASAALAETRGVFPAFKGSVYDTPKGMKVRNATCTTIAPTGTLSIIAGCSSGIEPLFALSYIHNILDGANMVEVNAFFEKDAREFGFYSEDMMKKLATGTSLHTLKEVPQDIRDVYVTAHDITPEWHVKMQAAFQKSTHNAVSKTVNFAETATRADIAEVYMLAFEEGLKGITIYRDKSRDSQPLSTSPVEKKAEPAVRTGISPRERPKVTSATVEEVMTGCGTIYVTVGSDEYGICEVFLTLGKSGGCAAAQLEAIGRLTSISLRAGIDIKSIIKQLRGIRCPSISWSGGKSILSCADAIASVLEKHADDTPKVVPEAPAPAKSTMQALGLTRNVGGQCPECGNLLTYQEGCFVCHGCGYTKC